MKVVKKIDSIDKNKFFTKEQIKEDTDRLIANLWIQFGIDITNKEDDNEKYHVNDFTWSLDARQQFFKLNEKLLKKMKKDKSLPWLELDYFPKDEIDVDTLIEWENEFFRKGKKKALVI